MRGVGLGVGVGIFVGFGFFVIILVVLIDEVFDFFIILMVVMFGLFFIEDVEVEFGGLGVFFFFVEFKFKELDEEIWEELKICFLFDNVFLDVLVFGEVIFFLLLIELIIFFLEFCFGFGVIREELNIFLRVGKYLFFFLFLLIVVVLFRMFLLFIGLSFINIFFFVFVLFLLLILDGFDLVFCW